MKRKLVICRHTRTPDNKARRYTGQHDIQVDSTGATQASRLAVVVGGLSGICGIVSSDLKRTRHLARKIGIVSGHQPIYDARLREAAVGQLEKLTRKEIEERFPGQNLRTSDPTFDFRHLGGERASDVIQRQILALRSVAALFNNGTGNVRRLVVIGHGTALRLLFHNRLEVIGQLHDQGDYQEFDWPF